MKDWSPYKKEVQSSLKFSQKEYSQEEIDRIIESGTEDEKMELSRYLHGSEDRENLEKMLSGIQGKLREYVVLLLRDIAELPSEEEQERDFEYVPEEKQLKEIPPRATKLDLGSGPKAAWWRPDDPTVAHLDSAGWLGSIVWYAEDKIPVDDNSIETIFMGGFLAELFTDTFKPLAIEVDRVMKPNGFVIADYWREGKEFTGKETDPFEEYPQFFKSMRKLGWVWDVPKLTHSLTQGDYDEKNPLNTYCVIMRKEG